MADAGGWRWVALPAACHSWLPVGGGWQLIGWGFPASIVALSAQLEGR